VDVRCTRWWYGVLWMIRLGHGPPTEVIQNIVRVCYCVILDGRSNDVLMGSNKVDVVGSSVVVEAVPRTRMPPPLRQPEKKN